MSTLLSTAASFAAALMMGRSMIEKYFQNSYLQSLWVSFRSELTFVIEEHTGVGERNQIYDSVEHYLRAKIGSRTQRVRVSKTPRQKTTSFTLDEEQEVTDQFENFNVKWRYICIPPKDHHSEEKRYYELSFHKKHRAKVTDSYLDYVVARAKEIKDAEKVLKIFTPRSSGSYRYWESTILEHPSTFETLAMDSAEKKRIMDDLDMFVQRKEFYKNVGKAWKRG